MKSYAVESVYASVIVVAIFLMVPFFMPYDGDEAGLRPVGEYAIADEEKPEVFTRILDRVSSFYGIKRKNKKSNNTKFEQSTKKAKLEAEARLAVGKNSAAISGDASTTGPITESVSGSTQKHVQAKPQSKSEMFEFKGQLYPIQPDPYGNKYAITADGPIPLETLLSQGGRIVKPVYHYGNITASGHDGNSGNTYAHGAHHTSVKAGQNIDSYQLSKNSGVKGFKHGRSSSIKEGSQGNKENSFSGSSGGGLSLGNYDFNSGMGIDAIKQNISAKGSSGGKNSEAKAEAAEVEAAGAKVYVLEDSMPVVGTPMGIWISEYGGVGSVSLEKDAWGDGADSSSGTVVSIRLSDNYKHSQGILLKNERTRAEMTKALLNEDAVFTRQADNGGPVSNPWILPNDISNGPGKSFYENNFDILDSSKEKSKEWSESDRHYDIAREEISQASGGAVVPVAIIDGQKDANTMTSIPKDTYYYKVTSGLFNNAVVSVDNGGNIDLNKIDKNRVLVVVPEKPLAENLKKDGYKVAVFDRYIVTPIGLQKFYNETSIAVKGIGQAKEAEHEAKKRDISRSLNEIRP